ncbi:hypothetical protein EIO_1454 [Ketogulonicigenium vulgare Y25]|uniref:Uncharacterized protein n=1 Tax=Ketogulonicigenium vulgare (strain WSH-001) TaxID=759362 RepID=F9Y5V6_KETVW|nr:hypothetical protein EIO_1454 [Ketogulonicigenium vulgare Y25]AEM40781.1 hypothetical protein KVU_0942 [Ketogulonicigenium vulgare WSH-001]ALJ80948.1 hypothetical protein KVH_06995 [Ketogulonicigenium vulgare]ANW35015.1 hypothetical protein KvSKV_06965 [Ketogulonicigenium vulgare]AOZ54499.1 hypothetical protein KVC_1485 [Ketogulonicigenium vulgare]
MREIVAHDCLCWICGASSSRITGANKPLSDQGKPLKYSR